MHIDDIARQLCPAISSLDALLVPLSHGGCDGHGNRIAVDAELRRRMTAALVAAQVAIVQAHQQLTQQPYQPPIGNPS